MLPTVLIAEDEADLREYLADLFRSRGCEVTAVADGVAALEALSQPFHVGVIGMFLPGESGFRVLSEYKAAGGGCAIMTSPNGSPDHQNYAVALGADHFLVKPFAVDELLALAGPHIVVRRPDPVPVGVLD